MQRGGYASDLDMGKLDARVEALPNAQLLAQRGLTPRERAWGRWRQLSEAARHPKRAALKARDLVVVVAPSFSRPTFLKSGLLWCSG